MIKSLKLATLSLLMATAISCKDADHGGSTSDGQNSAEDAMAQDKAEEMPADQNQNHETIYRDYMALKDALVNDDPAKAKSLAGNLSRSLEDFGVDAYESSEQEELDDIIVDATEHAEHIAESEIDHQREHFKMLSKDMIDMMAITGTEMKLYEQFCPMYADGSSWISTEKEVRNPYYGSSMMNCGEVKREIN
jgi:hypothetical protein